MDNYEAIMKMTRQQLENFLDGIYCTGLNDGMFAMRLPEDAAEEILQKNPFDKTWLSSDAEKAVLHDEAEESERYLLNALASSALRNAGIDEHGNETDTNGTTIIF